VDVTKNYISVERISNLESPYIRSWHILWGTIRAHMRCVDQTNPQIQWFNVLCSVFEAKAEVDVFKLEKNNFEKLVVFTFIA